ncbi:MAG: hypothetical protein JKX73_08355, partial [Flavobacteriales bacterium]|nr:hypothetical protein [Flavobacteriales bacterium]
CVGDTTILSANFNITTYYEWTINDPSGMANVLYTSNTELAIVWVKSGTMCLDISAINKCGESNSVKCLTVIPESNATLFPDSTICEGDSIWLIAVNTFKPDNQFTWYADGVEDTSRYVALGGTDSLHVSPSDITTYVVKIDNGCPDWDTVVVDVVKRPNVVSQFDDICIGDSTQLNASVLNAQSYTWSPATGLSDISIIDPMAGPIVPTTYTVAIVYDSICPNLMDTFFLDVNSPDISAGGDATIFKGDGVTIYAGGGVDYVWFPTAGLSSPNNYETFASPDTTTTYYVVMTDFNGCSDTDSVTIEVVSYKFGPEVPDAFTPNGSGDPTNDLLYVFDVLGDEGDAVAEI